MFLYLYWFLNKLIMTSTIYCFKWVYSIHCITVDRTIDYFSDYITLDKDLGYMYLLLREDRLKLGPPCPCSDGSWVYNDLCNQFKFRS